MLPSRLLLLSLLVVILLNCLVEAKRGKGKGKGKKGPRPKPAKKPSKKPAKNKKCKCIKPEPEAPIEPSEVEDLALQLETVTSTIDALKENVTTTMDEVNQLLVSSRTKTATANEYVVLFDYYLTAQTKCGPQTITGWTKKWEYWSNGATVGATDNFNTGTGTFTVPTLANPSGYYNICGFARFQNSGNAVDITIKKNGAVVAAFGDAVQTDWRSTGTCVILDLTTANTVTMHLESGGSSDCIQETGWFYARFNGYLISDHP